MRRCPVSPGLAILVLAMPMARIGAQTSTPAAPVAPAIPPSHRAGFELLPPETTGLSFINRLPPAVAAQNWNLMNGSGVAAGDFDGDGRCDLYFCAIQGTNTLYRNLGDWRFEEMAVAAGVACPEGNSTGAVFADVDGDGDLDLLVSTLGSGVRLFINGGSSRFTEVTADSGLAARTGSMSMALGDVDGDGDLDLYVANYGAFSVLRSGGRAEVRRVNGNWVVLGPHAHRLRFIDGRLEEVGEVDVLYLNDGKGRFTPVPWNSQHFIDRDGNPKGPPPDYGLGIQMRDINGDGAPDIYVCNDFQSLDRLWINDGRGNFREASHTALRKFPFSSMGVDFADLDRDGHLDFFVVEMAARLHTRRQQQVTGAHFLPNMPGRFEYRPEVTRNALYRGNGDATWSEIAEFAGVTSTDWSWQPVFLDVDLDGFEDLLVASGMLFDTQDRDTIERVRSFGRQPPEASRTNLLLNPPFPSPVQAFRNRGDFTFEDMGTAWGFNQPRINQGIALADLDGDGDLDLAINSMNSPAQLYRNIGTAPRVAVRLQGLAPNRQGIGARIRVLGGPVIQQQEMVSGGRYLSGDDALRTFAVGDATALTLEVTWRSGTRTVVSNALPNQIHTVLESRAQPVPIPPHVAVQPAFTDLTPSLQHRHHETLFDDYARQPLLPRQFSSLGPGIAWADLDGDGRDELVVGTGAGGRITGFRFNPDGGITRLDSTFLAPDDITGFTAWITPDGRPALLAGIGRYESTTPNPAAAVQISLIPGTTSLAVIPFKPLPADTAHVGPLTSVDIDGDGDLDLFAGGGVEPGAYPRSTASRFYRNDSGELVADTVSNQLLKSVGIVSAATWSDLENDGFPDLILACEWGPVRLFRNRRGTLETWDPIVTLPGGTGRVPLSQLTGWWTSVVTGDFNGDGRPDIVVGNWGRNSGHAADPSRPLRLYFGDLGQAGVMDLIESHHPFELDAEMPRRSLNALGQALPGLAELYPTHRQFSTVPVPQLFKALKLAPPHVEAVTLDSLLFLNLPEGLQASPLPPQAQWAPAFGLVVADFNGDGFEDLFMAQNFFATRPEWPRCDAGRGLWLRGDGTGGLIPVPATESGVVVLGEQRGAATADFDADGRPDLVVTQNGAATTLWHNQHAVPALRVRLRGPQGNPSGLGATLRLVRANRPPLLREIRSGSGYWSQDSATVLLPQSDPDASIEVTWPGGTRHSHRIPEDSRELILTVAGETVTVR